MRIIIFSTFLLFFILQSLFTTTLSVLPFEDATGSYGKDSGKIAAEIITTTLSKSKLFVIVERADISKILQEQGFTLTGVIDSKTAVNVGKIIGAKYLLIGKVTEVEKLSGIDPRYKKCCVLAGCLTFGCLGAIAGLIFPSKGFKVGLNVRIVDTETGEIVFTASAIDEDDTIS